MKISIAGIGEDHAEIRPNLLHTAPPLPPFNVYSNADSERPWVKWFPELQMAISYVHKEIDKFTKEAMKDGFIRYTVKDANERVVYSACFW